MPFFGILFLLAGIVLFVFTNLHAPEQGWVGGTWVYKPEFYYLFVITALIFCGYGLYEIAAELLSKRQEQQEGEGLEAQRKGNFIPSAAIAVGLIGTFFLGAVVQAWYGFPMQTSRAKKPDEVQRLPDTGTDPAAKSPPAPQPAPLTPEAESPFRVGSKWAIDWQSKYRYKGILVIKGQLAPDQYISRITVKFRNSRNVRKTVAMEGLVTIRGKEVIINCRNPSVSWWDTDDFYLEWKNNTMTGYNVDVRGRRGEAVFTLVEGAQVTG